MKQRFTRLTRHTFFVFVGILLSLLAGCNEPAQHALRFGLSNMPANLDPRYATDAASSRIGRLLFQRLVDFDAAQKPVPDLAQWRLIHPKLYRFTIRDKSARFHDGSMLTSSDVKATYDFVLNPENASPHRATLALIEKITTPDDTTIDFHLSRADPLFPGYLLIGIVPQQKILDKHPFENRPIGSGPFKFVDWPEDGKLVVERLNDALRVEFIHVPNPTVRVLKLLRGEIDMVQNDLQPELVSYLETIKELNITRASGSNFAYLGFNMEDPVLADVRVRRAIAHGIDRDTIIKYVFGNAARPANALLPPNHWAGNDALKGYAYDPELARKLLLEAGFNQEKRLTLTYKTSSDPFRVRLATILQDQLGKIGIDVDIRSYDWGTFYGDIKSGRFQLYSLAWIGIKTPDIFRYVFHSKSFTPNGANRGRFVDPRVDQLIETAESKQDLDEQAKYYRELQALVLEQLPYVPLWYEDHVFISRDVVKGYTVAPDGNFDGLLTVTKQ